MMKLNAFLFILGLTAFLIICMLSTQFFKTDQGLALWNDIQPKRPMQTFSLSVSKKRRNVIAQRKEFIEKACKSWGNVNGSYIHAFSLYGRQIVVNDEKKVMACFIPKVGCTNLRRVFLYLAGAIDRDQINTISGYNIYSKYNGLLKTLASYSPPQRTRRLKHYRKFIFVRNPLERFVSGYTNKLYHPNRGERDRFLNEMRSFYSAHKEFPRPGKIINRTVSFQDWVQFTVDKVATGSKLNSHFAPYVELCQPCAVHYNFIAKFETIDVDADYIFKTVGIDVGYPLGARKAAGVVMSYIKQLPIDLYERLVEVYKHDFKVFDFQYPAFGANM